VKLALCARTAAVLEATAEEIRRETDTEIFAAPVDVTEEAQVHAFVEQAAAKFGAIDICVANAGGPPAKPFAATTTEEWRRAIDLNLMSTLFLAREVLPGMRARRWGRLITITSLTVKAARGRPDPFEFRARGRCRFGEEPFERIRIGQRPCEQRVPRLHGDGPSRRTVIGSGEIRRSNAGRDRETLDQPDSVGPASASRGVRGCGRVPMFRTSELHHWPIGGD